MNEEAPVLVTGANGYVASWLVKRLLEKGLTVHATVRNLENQKKLSHLQDLQQKFPGKLFFFQADLLKPNSFSEAMQHCRLVFHTASPFQTNVKNPLKELIEPAVQGTENILQSANQTSSVERIVLTSSCAAMYSDAIDTLNAPGGCLTEKVWNETSSLDYQPYSYSKTLAEKKAWEIASKQDQWDLVTINPSFVMGPPLNPHETASESIQTMVLMGSGKFKLGAPRMGVGVVDVRDVAEAHLQAGFTPEAKGRYLTSAHNSDIVQMAQCLQAKYGQAYPLPKKALPKWLLLLLGPLANKLFTRTFVQRNVNVVWKADNSKIKKDLNLQFRSLQETMEDGFQAIIDAGLLPKNH